MKKYDISLTERIKGFFGFNRNKYPNPDKLREVYSGDYSLVKGTGNKRGIETSSQSDRPIMATWGVGPCLTLGGYDSKQKVGFLVHDFDGRRICHTADDLVEKLQIQREGLDFQFYLVGGVQGWSNDVLREVEKYLTQRFPTGKVFYRDVLDKWDLYNLGKSFVLDTRDGKVNCLDPTKPISQMGISIEN